MRVAPRRHGARYGHRHRTAEGEAIEARPAQAHGIRISRRTAGPVQRRLRPRARIPDQPERIPAQSACLGHHDREGGVRRDRGVQRRSTRAEDVQAGRGGQVVGSDDSAMAPACQRRRDEWSVGGHPRESTAGWPRGGRAGVGRRPGRGRAGVRRRSDVGRTVAAGRLAGMERSLWAVLIGTFTLRFSTALTGTTLIFYLADLPKLGGPRVDPAEVGALVAVFFAAELVLSTPFGIVSDRLGHHRVMQLGPIFGAVAVVLTWATTDLFVLGGTRLLEGASTAASVPSILGFIALATAHDESLRGRASARFEGATLAGIGGGAVAAGVLYGGVGSWDGFGRTTFLLNASFYAISFLIYRFGVTDPRAERGGGAAAPMFDLQRYRRLLASSHVWLLAPTWIAINAALGLWTTQSIFQIVKYPPAEFSDQYLMGLADPIQVSVGLTIALVVFFGGLAFWGERFKRYRRTSIIFVGICGGALMIVAATLVNHSAGLPFAIRGLEAAVAAAGLFVLAGATPAALGLLADVSESFPNDRGAIMSVYSVFLAPGQITGSLIGGGAAEARRRHGLLVATLVLLLLAL